jgi:hypothetical protein
MGFENFFESVFNVSIWTVAKWLVEIALLVYLVFAIIVVRQVYMMTEAVKEKFNWIIKIISWIHLLFAILVILISLVIL